MLLQLGGYGSRLSVWLLLLQLGGYGSRLIFWRLVIDLAGLYAFFGGRVPLALRKVQPSLPRSLGSRASGVTAANNTPSTRRGQAPPPDSRRTRPPLFKPPRFGLSPAPSGGFQPAHPPLNPFSAPPAFSPAFKLATAIAPAWLPAFSPFASGLFRAAPLGSPSRPSGDPRRRRLRRELSPWGASLRRRRLRRRKPLRFGAYGFQPSWRKSLRAVGGRREVLKRGGGCAGFQPPEGACAVYGCKVTIYKCKLQL